MSVTIIKKRSEYLDYILEGLNDDVRIIDVQTKESLIWRAMHLVFNGHSEDPSRFLLSYISWKTYRQLRKITNDNVLLMGAIDFRLSNIICRLLPRSVRIHSWNWNPMGTKERNRLEREVEYSKSKGRHLSVFNPLDAIEYGLEFVNQVYRFSDTVDKPVTKHDCYWLGAGKGRTEIIEYTRKILERNGIECNFKVISRKSDFISYRQNLHLLQESKCLVDFTNPDNQGLSLRVMEALFFKKKLISNNSFILECDFYNPDDFFILGHDDESRLTKFIDSPYTSIPDDILIRYDINSWIKQFPLQLQLRK